MQIAPQPHFPEPHLAPVPTGTERAGEIIDVPRTTITAVIDRDAEASPDTWSDQNPQLFGKSGIALNESDLGVNLENNESFNPYADDYVDPSDDDDKTVYATPESGKAWRVNIYGARWATANNGRTVLSSVRLERLPELHGAIIEAVLEGEDSRPAHFVPNATQKFGGGYTDDDMRIWLEDIHEGNSPIMATGNLNSDGSPEFIRHDYADFHPASNLLWGRKTQGRVTVASGYELERRRKGMEMPRGRGLTDGVGVIDRITCSEEQLDLIDYAMYGPGNSPKERILAAWETLRGLNFSPTATDADYEITKPVYTKWQNGQYLDSEVAAYNISQIGTQTDNLENFIQWYASDGDRLASDEERETALKDALTDITRVAEKLLDLYDGTDLELTKPDVVEEPTETEYDLSSEPETTTVPEFTYDDAWYDASEPVAVSQEQGPKGGHARRLWKAIGNVGVDIYNRRNSRRRS